MRCPECGGLPRLMCVDVSGRSVYQCGQGVAQFGWRVRASRIDACGTVMDSRGRALDETVAYWDGEHTQTVCVRKGKVV